MGAAFLIGNAVMQNDPPLSGSRKPGNASRNALVPRRFLIPKRRSCAHLEKAGNDSGVKRVIFDPVEKRDVPEGI
jgi:hypothetical protein